MTKTHGEEKPKVCPWCSPPQARREVPGWPSFLSIAVFPEELFSIREYTLSLPPGPEEARSLRHWVSIPGRQQVSFGGLAQADLQDLSVSWPKAARARGAQGSPFRHQSRGQSWLRPWSRVAGKGQTDRDRSWRQWGQEAPLQPHRRAAGLHRRPGVKFLLRRHFFLYACMTIRQRDGAMK